MTIVNDSFGTNQYLTSITIPDVIKYSNVFTIDVTTTDNSTSIIISTSDSTIFSINSSTKTITVNNVGTATITVTQGSESITTSSLTINPYTPVITFSNPLSVFTYGNGIDISILSAVVDKLNGDIIPGTKVYHLDSEIGTVINRYTADIPPVINQDGSIGTRTVVGVFTPTNLSLYNIVSISKSVTINKKSISVFPSINNSANYSTFINKPIPTTIDFTYYQFVGSDTYDNSLSGTSNYILKTNIGVSIADQDVSSLPAGTYYLYATQNTLASNKYTFIYSNIPYVINKYNVSLSYSLASLLLNFQYGTALTADYFTATYSAAENDITPNGTLYYYTNLSSQALSIGSIINGNVTSLYVTFVPDSNFSDMYNNVESSRISITVTPINNISISYSISSNLTNISYGVPLVADQLNAIVTYNEVDITSIGTVIYRTSLTNVNSVVSIGSYLSSGINSIYAFYSHPTNNYININTTDSTNTSITVSKINLTGTVRSLSPSIFYSQNAPQFTIDWVGFGSTDTASSSITGVPIYTIKDELNNIVTNVKTANVGTYSVIPSMGTLSSGNYTLILSSNTASFNINKATPSLSLASTTYVYGNRSYLTSVDAVYNSLIINGTLEFRLNNSSGLVLTTSNYIPVGSNTLYIIFTPTSSNYLSTIQTFSNIIITKSTPILSYVPSIITYSYGNALNVGNLNATATLNSEAVNGTFSYTYKLNNDASVTGPSLSSTILIAGIYTLTATFVPIDTSNFVSSDTVLYNNLTVSKVNLTLSVLTNPVRFYYGLNVPIAISYGYSGFVNSETVSIFSGQQPDFQVSTNNPQTTLITKANLAGSSVGSGYFINAIQGTLTSNNYNFIYGTVSSCSIDKATPIVTLTIASNLRTFDYGTALTSAYFNGLATVKDVNNNDVSISGTFVFNDYYKGVLNIGVGYIFNSGAQRIQCSFNPSDTSKYNGGWSNVIDLTINKITPTITYTIPSNLKNINYGTALVSSQLSAVVKYNNIIVNSGTITYKPNSLTSTTNYTTSIYPSADLTTIYAIFTDSNYNSVSTFDTITVNKINATLGWKYPILQNIAYGRLLSNYQLCGQTFNDPNNSVPGIIQYKLLSNDLPIVLNQILDVGTYDFKAILVVTNPNFISETLMIQNSLTIVKNKPSVSWVNPINVVVGTSLSSTQLNAVVSVSNATFTYSPSSGTIMNTATDSQSGPIELNINATYDNSNFLFDSISTKVNLNVNN